MFVSVPQQAFLTDILKTWLSKLQDTVGPDVSVLPKYPEYTEALKLPVLVLRRVSDETMILARNSGFFGYQDIPGENTVGRLEGWRYETHYQLDIMARSNSEMLSLVSQVQGMLIDPNGTAFSDESTIGSWQTIPVLHFADVSSTGSATDIRICYKFKEITGIQVEGYNKELLQYSITIPFWCDYMQMRNVDRILSTGSDVILQG